jgi:hypothetical protein
MKQKIFVPFSEELLAAAGSPLGELVPYQLEYRCVRLLDGTYDFTAGLCRQKATQKAPLKTLQPVLQKEVEIGHAA